MKLGMTLWKVDPLYPNPFSPVHRARKFSAVLGTTSALSYKQKLNFKEIKPKSRMKQKIRKNHDIDHEFFDGGGEEQLPYKVKILIINVNN